MMPDRIKQWAMELGMAAEVYALDVFVLAAIMDRESRGGEALTPKGPHGVGDQGHGRGLMQIDDRWHKLFVATGLWQEPIFNFMYAARLLRQNLDAAKGDLRQAVAAYNCGWGNVQRAMLAYQDPDRFTAHGDYSQDVLKRAEEFKKT